MENILKGRFAPSPSGRMHLGNIFAAVISYSSVKRRCGKWLLRIEDLDPQRSKREYSEAIEDDLYWLGLHFDEGGLNNIGDNPPYSQSLRTEIYAQELQKLCSKALIYPCSCSRSEINTTNAPHASDGRIIYHGKCRPAKIAASEISDKTFEHKNLRINIPDEDIEFQDFLYGKIKLNIAREFGDISLRRADGALAYQLAVVVDDARMGVTEVCRGVDLLPSSALQIFLLRKLGYPRPHYFHIPLLTDLTGRRLSKRDNSLAMDTLRKEYTPEEIIGRVAFLAGQTTYYRPMKIEEMIDIFNPFKIPQNNICAY